MCRNKYIMNQEISELGVQLLFHLLIYRYLRLKRAQFLFPQENCIIIYMQFSNTLLNSPFPAEIVPSPPLSFCGLFFLPKMRQSLGDNNTTYNKLPYTTCVTV